MQGLIVSLGELTYLSKSMQVYIGRLNFIKSYFIINKLPVSCKDTNNYVCISM